MSNILFRIFALLLCTMLLAVTWIGFAKTETYSQTSYSHIGYPRELTGAYTGGFAEETCRSCHFDYDLNPPGGSLSLQVVSPDHSDKKRHAVIISVQRGGLGAAGFQLTARYPDGSQAGSFNINENPRVHLTSQISDSIQYIQHSARGAAPKETDSTSWKMTWIAPTALNDTVIFNIAANAANGDQSEFGDWIYSRKVILPPH